MIFKQLKVKELLQKIVLREEDHRSHNKVVDIRQKPDKVTDREYHTRKKLQHQTTKSSCRQHFQFQLKNYCLYFPAIHFFALLLRAKTNEFLY